MLCGDTLGCNVRETLASIAVPAGTHSVVRITFPEEASAEELEGAPPCLMEQFLVIAQDKGGTVTKKKPFAIGCSDEAPAGWCGLPPRADVRVEGMTVTANWYTTHMRCAGAYRSSGTEVVSLETLHSLRSESESYRSLHFSESSSKTWDWQSLRGTFTWSASGSSCPALERKPTALVPQLELDDSFVKEGWKTISLSSCSTLIEEKTGVALGRKKAWAELRLVASHTGMLFVDVKVGDGKAPPPTAELKVCVASGVPVVASYCEVKEAPTCVSIGLDGSIRAGQLGPEGNAVIERAPERLRFKIALPPDHGALTVAYVDPKSGESLSTSPLKPLDSTILGDLFHLDAEVARCQVQGPGLVLVRNPDAL